MAELDPSIILSGRPVAYEPLAAAQLRALKVQEARQELAIGALNQELGGEKLQAAKYSNQETAMQLAEQQALMDATRDTIARRATPQNPSVGQPASPTSPIIPGIVGVAPAAGMSANTVAATTPDTKSVFEETLDNLAGKVRPSTLMAWQTQNLGMKEKLAAIGKTIADANEATQKVRDAHADALAALMQTVRDSGYSPVAMGGAIAYMRSHGFSDEATQMQQAASANPDNLAAIVDPILSQASAARVTSQARQLTANVGAAKEAIEAPGQKATAEQQLRVNTAGKLLAAQSPEQYGAMRATLPADLQALFPATFDRDAVRRAGMTPEQQQLAEQSAASLTQTTANQNEMRDLERRRVGLEAGRLGLEQRRFDATIGSGLDANGKPLSPDEAKAAASKDPVAVAIANYQVPPLSTRSMASANGKATMAKVFALNPGYDGTQFPARNKTAMDFSAAGQSGKALTATDTALSHIAAISQAGQALNNGDFQLINRIANEMGVQVGKSPKNTYDTIVQTVAPEISKAVIGGVGGEQERQALQKRFSSDLSPQQREQAIAGVTQLLGARFEKSRHAYESTMGKPLDRQLSPESQAILQKYTSGNSGTVANVAPAGKIAVVSPEGQKGYIDASKWAEAQKRGFKRQ